MRGGRAIGAVLAVGVAGVTAACGGSAATRAPAHQAAAASTPAPVSMVTSTATSGATWATLPMGAAAGPNQFWELFSRPAGRQQWALHTPPDVATNGALVLAAHGATLTAGIRPSIDLTFSPITSTADAGQSWTTSPPQTGLANRPDALAAAPSGQLIADGQDGQIDVLAPGGSSWSGLISRKALSTVGGCGLTSVSAVAYTPAGVPLVAGTCRAAGTAGVLVKSAAGWQLAGLKVPATLGGGPVQVLRLTRTGSGDVAVLRAGTGLVVAWSGDGSHWALSRVLNTAGAEPASVSFGFKNSVAVELTGGRAQTVSGPGGAWTALPALPPVAAGHSVALALPAGGGTEALAADAGIMTVYRLAGAHWAKAQTIRVPIQYGSSGGS